MLKMQAGDVLAERVVDGQTYRLVCIVPFDTVAIRLHGQTVKVVGWRNPDVYFYRKANNRGILVHGAHALGLAATGQ